MAESTPGRMDLMPGYEVWEDGTYEMTTGDPGGLSKYYAKDTTEPWYHTVGVQHDDAFIIRPVILREGPFKDHKVLVLEPFTQTFRFLDLPPEIRTMVYGMMLKGTTATVIVSTYKPNHRPRRPCGVTFRDKLQHGEYDWDPRSFTSLFRVNKLILAEAASVFYSNTFDFESTKAMHLFLETIGSMRPYLRSLRLTGVHAYDDRVRRAIFGLLESAKDLRTIYLPLAMMRKPSDRELPVVMASLIADSRTLLDTRRAARRAGAKEVDPISLFEIDNTRLMCYQCCRKPARPELCRTETARDWDIPCLRIEAHCLAMTARLQSEVARALGMRV
ncbi:hypothetical protein LTR91_005992 [Friedmanniomyces endolithicus]|uniref:Uncharacterized protein n=1 Tax=Friedmanniomyces endolithicus TaxID=329885 RepID=A0AAN6KSZ3_9PEZI|nr:hypothetical protein LTS01_020517 [Friedmanniomyces endolithicus]KAK0999710.1 hypothetical protein LTR91_005992 [Friedmanniomyces endolithicus]KAK1032743.1 hypothetical protein LTS16_016914 [Friedmanniomyces endolithicus]KAK1081412.1 hypothetical protein LTR33_004710 [Friedmanniomyces endolithicus]